MHIHCFITQAVEIVPAMRKDLLRFSKQLRLLGIRQDGPPVRASPTSRLLRSVISSAGTVRIDQFPPDSNIIALAKRIAAEQELRQIAHVSIFFSAAGAKTPLHYDANDVLVIQGRGLKTVLIARTALETNPETDKLLSELDGVGPLEGVEIGAGEAILIPKGVPHATTTARLSLTMGVSFAGPRLGNR